MKSKIHINSLLFKIVSTVIGGTIFLALWLSFVNITISKKVFVEHFADSQKKIFHQIDMEFYQFYSDMVDIIENINKSQDIKDFFLECKNDTVWQMKNRYLMDQQLKKSKITDYSQISVFLLGKNEKSHIYNSSDAFSMSKDKIWNSKVAKNARKNPKKIVSVYEEKGFTDVMKSSPVVVLAKACSYQDSNQTDMIIFVSIKENDIKKMYSHFTSETSDIVILNQDRQVVSSNNETYFKSKDTLLQPLNTIVTNMVQDGINKKNVDEKSSIKTYLIKRLQSTDYLMVGIINPEHAFREQYNIGKLVLWTLVISTVIVIIIAIFIRQQAKPLGILVLTMRNSKEKKFKEHVPITGTYEVQELSKTYNEMVDELEAYIQQLIQVEEDKRTAEIHALQMQINPHYMYNTLTSIKWLIWQGDADKSTKVIDAFILLLRNVISNTCEFVTLEQEITNLKNYIFINQVRYGDAILVEFFVLPKYNHFEIPKLILQPFVENAFFHAFPDGRNGRIQIFVKEENKNLRFEITDNGIGISPEQLEVLNGEKNQKSEHFTGIGIGNVDDRIKLIYGLDYGIHIRSTMNKGTTVTLVLPKK